MLDARILFLSDEERRDRGGQDEMSLLEKLDTVSTHQLSLKHEFTVGQPTFQASAEFLLKTISF